MKLSKQMNWLSAEDFQKANPLSCKVTAVEEMNNKWGGMDTVLFFEIYPTKEIKQMSLYKQNLNNLIDIWGDESDKWVNKLFMIQQEESINGSNVRRIIIR